MKAPLLTTSGIFVLVALSTGFAQVPAPSIQPGGTNGPQFSISGTAGTPYSLETSINLSDWTLLTDGIAPEQFGLVNLDPDWTNRPMAFFRTGTNYDPDSLEGLEGFGYLPPPAYYIFLSNAPPVLVPGQAFDLGVCVADAAGNVAQINGYAAFSLVGADGQPAAFAYTFSPSGISIVNGSGQVSLTLQTSSDVTGAQIQLVSGVPPSPHPQDHSPTLASLLSNPAAQVKAAAPVFAVLTDPGIPPADRQAAFYEKLLQLRTNYTSAPSPWTYPLPTVAAPADGFGSDRSQNSSPYPPVGRLHTGADLKAVYGTAVSAAKNGIIISWRHLGPASSPVGGYQVLVDHGNGTWTRYLHVKLNSNKHLYDPVAAGEPFATVATTKGSHLHFELCRDPAADDTAVAADPAKYFGAITYPPVRIVNPVDLRFTVGASDRLFPASYDTPPAVTNVIITGLQPWSQAVPATKSAPAGPSVAALYIVAQIVDWKGGYTLPLHGIDFESEGNAPVPLVFDEYLPGNPATAAHYLPALHQDGDESGLARYASPAAAKSKANYYRYWFSWDTRTYSSAATGPRWFRLTATNDFGVMVSQQFTFGPQIKGGMVTPVGPQQYQFTNVAYLGTNLLADPSQPDPNFSQPDQYQLQIIQANGQPLTGVKWSPVLLPGDYTPVFTVHTNEQVYAFTLPSGQDSQGLRVRVSSRLATNIADEVSLCSCDTAGMALIPAGSFTMGNCMEERYAYAFDELPLHMVYVSAFYMDTNLVAYSQWQSVYTWAVSHGYSFDDAGLGKAPNHPVQTVTWYDVVKWCNARSQQAGCMPVYYTDVGLTQVYTDGDTDPVYPNWSACGYRLPTEAEWEKAARGGLSGHRFPWGDTISWSQANYFGDPLSLDLYGSAYDLATAAGYDPAFSDGAQPYTSPVGYFAPNGYGLYDMAGNVYEWCWDWYDPSWYSSTGAIQSDTRGPSSSPYGYRVLRGGSWGSPAPYGLCAYRGFTYPTFAGDGVGFRCVRGR